MSVIYIVLPLAFILGGSALAAFIWSARKGQLDDLETPALRMLHDDEPVAKPAAKAKDEGKDKPEPKARTED